MWSAQILGPVKCGLGILNLTCLGSIIKCDVSSKTLNRIFWSFNIFRDILALGKPHGILMEIMVDDGDIMMQIKCLSNGFIFTEELPQPIWQGVSTPRPLRRNSG